MASQRVVSGTWAFAPRVDTIKTLLYSLSILFGIFTVWIRVEPYIPGDFATKNVVLALALVVSFIVSVVLIRRRSNPTHSETSVSEIAPLGVVVVSVGAFIGAYLAAGAQHLAWAMNNDMVWNTVSTRISYFTTVANSLSNHNPAPLTSGILGAAMSAGRAATDSSTLLLSDVTRISQVWVLLIGLTSIIAAVIAHTATRGSTRTIRWVVVVGTAIIPLSWLVAGRAISFGFVNSTVALVILLLSYALIQRSTTHPGTTAFALSMLATSMLATWAPLTIVLIGLLGYFLLHNRHAILSQRRELLVTVAGLVVLGAYGLLVTLSDLLAASGSLATDGGIFDLRATDVALVVLTSVGAIVVSARYLRNKGWWPIAIVLATSALGFAYLVYQRRATGNWWGYYPVKFAWLVEILLAIINVTTLLPWVLRKRKNEWVRVLTTVLCLLVLAAPFVRNGFPGLSRALTPVEILSSNERDALVPEISRLSAGDSHNLVSGFTNTPSNDLFMNNWLLQLSAHKDSDKIRWYSYFADGTDLSLTCEAATTWGPDAVVVTKSAAVQTTLATLCPTVHVEMVK